MNKTTRRALLGTGAAGLTGLTASVALPPGIARADHRPPLVFDPSVLVAMAALLSTSVTELQQRASEDDRPRPGQLALRVNEFYRVLFFPPYLSLLSLWVSTVPSNRSESRVLAPVLTNLPILSWLSFQDTQIRSARGRARGEFDEEVRSHDLLLLGLLIGSSLTSVDSAIDDGVTTGLASWLLLLLTMIAIDTPGLGLASLKMLLALQQTLGLGNFNA